MADKKRSPVGLVQTLTGYAVVNGAFDVTYFMPPSDDPSDDDTARDAEDYRIDQGGTVYRITVKSEVTWAEEVTGNAAWVEGGMEGDCPLCGEPSGCHTDEGDCDAPETIDNLSQGKG